MTRVLRPETVPRGVLVLLALSALAIAVGGLEHARLFHRGYSAVGVVGPLFALNAIGSAVAILLLVFARPTLFVLAALGISIGSLVSIFISHSSSFFGFAEGGYDGSATVIVVAEIASVVLIVLAVAVNERLGAGR